MCSKPGGCPTRCCGLSMGLLFSLQSPRIKAAQECPAGVGGFDALGRPGLSPLSVSNSAHSQTQNQGSLSGRGPQADCIHLPIDGLFPYYPASACTSPERDKMCAPLQERHFQLGTGLPSCSISLGVPALQSGGASPAFCFLLPCESHVCCAVGQSLPGQCLAISPQCGREALDILCGLGQGSQFQCHFQAVNYW